MDDESTIRKIFDKKIANKQGDGPVSNEVNGMPMVRFGNSPVSDKDKAPQMDWQQVVLNGGPPCFARPDDEADWYCGRARRWAGHDGEHKFVSLADLLATTRKEARAEAFRDAMALANTCLQEHNHAEDNHGQAACIYFALERAATDTQIGGE